MAEYTRAERKFRKYHGISMLVSTDRVVDHLRMLKGEPYYMSNARISELAGIAESNLCQILSGQRGRARYYEPVKSVHRDTEAAILEVLPEIDPPARGGGHVPPLGTRRRLQALAAAGFPLNYLAQGMGWGTDPQPVHRLIMEKTAKNFVFHSTHLKACRLYDKLSCTDPHDMDFHKPSIQRSINMNRPKGWAPPSCWDPDTIDDPEAIPEWTGACGTPEGYLIHGRESIPICPPCAAARDSAESNGLVFSPDKLREARRAAGLSSEALAQKCDITMDTMYRWQQYSGRKPRGYMLDKVCAVLGVQKADLMDKRTNVPGAMSYNPELIRNQFSRYKLVELREKQKLSTRELGKRAGVSRDSIAAWESGRSKPQYENLLKLSRALDVHHEELMLD